MAWPLSVTSAWRRLAGGLVEGLALGDEDLGADDVDAGHLLGDGVLDLDARVHLDEEEIARVAVDQELDGAGALVVGGAGDLQAERADVLALLLGQVGGGGALDDLLVAALDRAVALPQVIDRPELVAEDLHLDVAGVEDHLLEVALAVAEGGLGLAAPLLDLLDQLLGLHHRPHPAPAAAPARLEHEGIADGLGHPLHLLHVVGEDLGRRDHRHPGLDRHLAGRGLVAEHPHGLGPGADEGDAGRGAGIDEVRVFGEEAVARVDGVGAGHPGDADDLGDREIGRDRAEPFADAVGLVGLEAVEAELVLLREDRHGSLAHLVGGAHHPNGDLAAIGDQNLLEFGHRAHPGGGATRKC